MKNPIWFPRILVVASLFGCSACALPQAAPVAVNVEEARSALEADYFVVPLVPPIVDIMGNRHEVGFPAAFRLGRYKPSIALKPGDVISITIFEVGNLPTFGAIPTMRQYGQLAYPPKFAKPARTNGSEALDMTPNATVGTVVAQAAPTSATAPASAPTQAPPAPQPSAPEISPLAPPSSRTLPPLTVEADGDILIPYAGRIHVAGMTPTEAAETIKSAIADKAVNAQVLVSFIANGTNQATVGGEVNRPGPVVLTLRGERLLDVIGQAGGSKWPAPDSDVDIVRGRSIAKVKLQTIVDRPEEDLVIRPNDQVFVTHDPRSFTVLGASQKVSQYTFDVPRVSLAEAVGRAGGAVDTIGNPAAIYLFREEPEPLAQEVLNAAASLSRSASYQGAGLLDARRVKIVYKINMNSGEGYFLARRITMVDKDVVLIANAEGTQLLKLFTLVRGVTGAVSDLNILGPGGPLASNTATVVR